MPDVKVFTKNIRVIRQNWTLTADGSWSEGLHVVTGAVGSGKSTLALTLAGLLKPSSGEIQREGISSLMMVFQDPEFQVTGSTVEEECSSWGVDPDAVLQRINLSGKNSFSIRELSRGELKRLLLECVLSKQYDLLILDEPFSSLDCYEKERVSRELSERRHGITVILTHEQSIFPRTDYVWEILDSSLCCRGKMPGALVLWRSAPSLIKNLILADKIPKNISPDDLVEALCRT